MSLVSDEVSSLVRRLDESNVLLFKTDVVQPGAVPRGFFRFLVGVVRNAGNSLFPVGDVHVAELDSRAGRRRFDRLKVCLTIVEVKGMNRHVVFVVQGFENRFRAVEFRTRRRATRVRGVGV